MAPYKQKKAVPQTPRERLIPGNERIKAPNGKTTWKIKL